jgi:hypothetical protein
MVLVATLILFHLALRDKSTFREGEDWQSGVYELRDSIISVGMCL